MNSLRHDLLAAAERVMSSFSRAPNAARDISFIRRSRWRRAQPPDLFSTIEAEVIPRLMLLSETGAAQVRDHIGAQTDKGIDASFDAGEVEAYARLTMADDPARAVEFVENARAAGYRPEIILLNLLAPAARHLGKLWEEDLADFSSVTIGLCRIQTQLRELSIDRGGAQDLAGAKGLALLAPMPGDHHLLGTLMVDTLFRRAGWQTETGLLETEGSLLDRVATDPYTMVGLSVCHVNDIERCRDLVAAIRKRSRNRDVIVMVGGNAIRDPDHAIEATGADGGAEDAVTAVEEAERLTAGQLPM